MRVMTVYSRIAVFAVAAMVGTCTVAAAQDLTSDPDQVRLETGDVCRLARALGQIAVAASEKSTAIERDYLARASPGLRLYAARYNVTEASVAASLAKHPDAYADLDRTADAVLGQEPAFRAAFRKLKELFPAAMFPPIWFVAGHHGPGGMVEREGVVIAIERYSENPQVVVPIVLHELAHFQSAMVQGVETYQRIYRPEGTLLALALREGTAELIAELTTGQHVNLAAERYGMQHERTLWARFREDMHRRDPGDWMFVQPSNGEWPQDLGYWIGYRIVKNYYDRAQNKPQAIREILGLTDFVAFLNASGYADRFER